MVKNGGGAMTDVQETIVVTHRDDSVLPPVNDRRTINFTLPLVFPSHGSNTTTRQIPSLSFTPSSPSSSSGSSGPATPISGEQLDTIVPYFPPTPEIIYTMGTHIVNPPSTHRNERPIYQTTNPVVPICSSSVLAIATLER